MSYICNSCLTIFEDSFILQCVKLDMYWIKNEMCPTYKCDGKLIEIDNNIIYFIQELWKLNIKTLFCCGGHIVNYNNFKASYSNNRPYLMLDNSNDKTVIDLLKNLLNNTKYINFELIPFKQFNEENGEDIEQLSLEPKEKYVEQMLKDIYLQIECNNNFQKLLYDWILVLNMNKS